MIIDKMKLNHRSIASIDFISLVALVKLDQHNDVGKNRPNNLNWNIFNIQLTNQILNITMYRLNELQSNREVSNCTNFRIQLRNLVGKIPNLWKCVKMNYQILRLINQFDALFLLVSPNWNFLLIDYWVRVWLVLPLIHNTNGTSTVF